MHGNRHRPDGTELTWKQIGVNGLISDPQLPFFVEWNSPPSCTPATAPAGDYSLACLEIAGDPQRVSEWLGETVEAPLEDVKVEWVAPHGTPGIIAAQFQTPERPGPDLTALRRPGPGPQPEHLAAPRDVRDREPRRRPRTAGSTAAMSRASPTGPAAPCSTSAAAPASTSPASRRPPPR